MLRHHYHKISENLVQTFKFLKSKKVNVTEKRDLIKPISFLDIYFTLKMNFVKIGSLVLT